MAKGKISEIKAAIAIAEPNASGYGGGSDLQGIAEGLRLAADSIRRGKPVRLLMRHKIARALDTAALAAKAAAIENNTPQVEKHLKEVGKVLNIIVEHRRPKARAGDVGRFIQSEMSPLKKTPVKLPEAIRKAAKKFDIKERTVRDYWRRYLAALDPDPQEPEIE